MATKKTQLKPESEDDKNDQNTNITTNDQDLSESNNQIKNKSIEEITQDLLNIKTQEPSIIDAPESLNLSKVEVPSKPDDELIKTAKESLNQKYSTKKQQNIENFESKINKLLNSSENTKNEAKKRMEEINNTFSESKNETKEQSIKRGLVRSSIIIGKLQNLDNEQTSKLSDTLNDLQKNLEASEIEINKLSKEKDDALNNLDIQYAIELDENLNKIKNEYLKEQQKAIDFNNKVDEMEAEYKLKLDQQKLKREKELLELGEDQLERARDIEIKKAQFDYLKSYLDSLNKDYALNILLTNKDFKHILGERYYELYTYLNNK